MLGDIHDDLFRRDLHLFTQRTDDPAVCLVRNDEIHVADAESLGLQHALTERTHAGDGPFENFLPVQVDVLTPFP